MKSTSELRVVMGNHEDRPGDASIPYGTVGEYMFAESEDRVHVNFGPLGERIVPLASLEDYADNGAVYLIRGALN